MESLRTIGAVLLVPDRGMPAAVAARRFGLALLLATLCATACGVAYAARVNVDRVVEADLEAHGKLKDMTDRELGQEIARRRHIAQISAAALGVVAMPGLCLLGAAGSALAGWLFARRGRARTGDGVIARGGHLAAASHALLPAALLAALGTLAALDAHVLSPGDPRPLVPASLAGLGLVHATAGPLHLIGALGFFGLWAAVLYGLGVAAATGLRRPAALALSLGGYVWLVVISRLHS